MRFLRLVGQFSKVVDRHVFVASFADTFFIVEGHAGRQEQNVFHTRLLWRLRRDTNF